MLSLYGCLACVLLTPGERPVTIKRTPTKGQVLLYQSRASVSIQGHDADLTSCRTKTVTDVDKEGNYTVESFESDQRVNDKPVQAPSHIFVTVSKPSGELISVGPPGTPSAPDRSSVLLEVYYPPRAVGVGETWSYEPKSVDKTSSIPFTAKMNYLGTEKVGTFDTWRIEENLKESEGDSPASTHIIAWLDVTDGSIVQETIDFSNLPYRPGVLMKGTMVLKRR
jgi:hypothetical protein